MSDRDRYARVKAVFDAACERPEKERAAFLDAACGDDESLRAEVDALLAAEDDPNAALGDAHQGAGPGILAAEVSSWSGLGDAPIPKTIDTYEILREIGRGGMGTVYEAEQQNPRRRVALKVIRTATMTPELVKRFRHEAQLLGQLDHPGIAHVYEAGAAEVGSEVLPYLVLELVDGLPLDEHVRTEALGPRDILELVAAICDAVQHAHQRGVIHRDLKPQNIVVRRANGDTVGGRAAVEAPLQPKVLDFGVARAVDPDLTLTTVQTHAGQVVGTLSYMSPEQVAGRTDIDTRCDVYALGVVLYELLSGRRPFELSGKPIAEAARIIEQDEPVSLGERVPALDGDVVTIVAKSMEKDRERRYRSAAELADDIRRYLHSEPISARPPSATYLLRRFARRNRVAVAGAAATFGVLVIGLVVSTSAFMTARQERNAKTRALETSDAVTEFLSDMLTAAQPDAQGRDVTVVQVLDEAAEGLGSRFADRPQVEARLRHVIGGTYVALGEYDAADSHAVAAVELRQLGDGPDSETGEALQLLGNVRYFRGEYEDALASYTEALDAYRATEPPDERGVVRASGDVAFALMQLGRLDESRTLFMKTSEDSRRLFGPESEESITCDSNLAVLESRREDHEASERIYLDVIERSRRVRGPDHPETVLIVANYASLLVATKRSGDAIPYLREALEAQERALGEAHSKTLITRGNLAVAHANTGEHDEAEAIVVEGLRRAAEAYGEEDRSTFFLRHAHAWIVRRGGDRERALPILERNLSLARRVMGEDAETTTRARQAMLDVLIGLGRYETCVDSVEAYVASAQPRLGPGDRRIIQARAVAGGALLAAEQFERAEGQFQAALSDASPAQTRWLAPQLARLYEAWGREADALEWREVADASD